MGTKNQPNPLPTLEGALECGGGPLLLRKVIRPTPWNEALLNQEPSSVKNYLHEQAGLVSLWQVRNDLDLRRVAIAINESRDSFRESIEFLPILPVELEMAGVAYQQSEGDTNCPTAAQLHYDAKLSEEDSYNIITRLLQERRQLLRCTKGQMSNAQREADGEGCFAVSETSQSCRCGEAR